MSVKACTVGVGVMDLGECSDGGDMMFDDEGDEGMLLEPISDAES